MYCVNCGAKIPDDSQFCTSCGARVEQQTNNGGGYSSANTGYSNGANRSYNSSANGANRNYNSGSGYNDRGFKNTDSSDAKGLQAFMTPANVEKFGPLVAFFPLILSILTFLFGIIFLFAGGVAFVLNVILTLIFGVVAIGASIGLVLIALNAKDSSQIDTWIAPIVVIVATLATLLRFIPGFGLPVFIVGLITGFFGLDFLGRITIGGNPMDSKMNIGRDFGILGDSFRSYKENNPTTVQLERAGYVDPENSYFDGSGAELLGLLILTSLVSTITCGIAFPWMICKIYKWRLSHTVINGHRLTFTGNGAELLGNWILWELLTIVTCGIYGFFTFVALKKWETSHTFTEDGATIGTSYFDGNSFEFMGYSLLGGLLETITCGIATPWVVCMIQGWTTKHQVISGRRMKFSGTGIAILGEYIIIAIFTLLTCGIYSAWGIVRMNKYIIRNTDFE